MGSFCVALKMVQNKGETRKQGFYFEGISSISYRASHTSRSSLATLLSKLASSADRLMSWLTCSRMEVLGSFRTTENPLAHHPVYFGHANMSKPLMPVKDFRL